MSDRGPGDVSRDAARSSPRDDGLSIVAGPHLLPSLGFFSLSRCFSKCSCTLKQTGTSQKIRNKLS